MINYYCDCKKLAVWCYMPGFSNGDYPYFCDDCVPRGCECNYHYQDVNLYHPPLDSPAMADGVENKDWKWIEKNTIWTYIDDQQREYPCAEYMYDGEGFERDMNPHELN